MAAELRTKIYGSPRPSFGPGFPTQLEAMQHYIWLLEEEYRLKGARRLDDKTPLRDKFRDNLRGHWEKQEECPKDLLADVDLNKKIKPFIDFYWALKDKKAKLKDQPWIDGEKEKLQEILDIEQKEKAATKKRSIEEVSTVIKPSKVLVEKRKACFREIFTLLANQGFFEKNNSTT